jgi:hypothetical protein
MSWTRFALVGLVVLGLVWATADTLADKPPLAKRVGGLLVGDQDLDGIYLTRDLNGDGDADDPDEATLYYQDPNFATNNVNSIFQSASGEIYYADIETDGVYILRDLNYDCDALDPDEFAIWFTGLNEEGFALPAPQGIWQASDGAVYIANAGTLSTPPDAIYRTVDLNGDGDAEDVGESKVWFDLENLMDDAVPFELVFIGDVAYFVDSAGDDKVWRIEDLNEDGEIDVGEFEIFIDETNPYGVGMFSALGTDYVSLYVIDLSGDPQVLFRLTDLNESGTIDDESEAVAIWDETYIPDPNNFEMSATFGLAVGPGGEIAVTSNGGDDPGVLDNVFRLVDLNADGDFYDEGETIIWAPGNGPDTFVERARAVEYILAAPGDVDGNGLVDLEDLAALLSTYGRCEGEEGYNAAADFDNDGCITLVDLAALLSRYGQSCP